MKTKCPNIARFLLLAVVIFILPFWGPAPQATEPHYKKLQLVTTTSLLADLVKNVAGSRADVTALVPPGADPHSYEPTLQNIRSIVYADAAFTNYLMLEEQALIKAITANLPKNAPNVALAEAATKHSAEVIPLVEDASLDTVWLGMRARTADRAADALAEDMNQTTGQVTFTAKSADGPGNLFGYLTTTFGQSEIYFNTKDGITQDDQITLPAGAHSHMSWAFDTPGIYHLELDAEYSSTGNTQSAHKIPTGTEKLTFAVGIDPLSTPETKNLKVIDSGHVDITADPQKQRITLFSDPKGGGEYTQQDLPPSEYVIHVPTKALKTIPATPQHRFLGARNRKIYLLPQAVLGKHVHGEIDPHLWHDVKNVKAYVQAIKDTLTKLDPSGAGEYEKNTERFNKDLDSTDAFVREQIEAIEPTRRNLVTTHDAYGYLAHAYGLKIAGYVTLNPGMEPSVADRIRLAQTMTDLKVPAVFVEPYLLNKNQELRQVARDAGATVCPLYSDTLDSKVPSYTALMRFNATSIRRCLSNESAKATTTQEPISN